MLSEEVVVSFDQIITIVYYGQILKYRRSGSGFDDVSWTCLHA